MIRTLVTVPVFLPFKEKKSVMTQMRKQEIYVCLANGVFTKWIRNSVNSGNLINHWSVNWSQFKNNLCYLCLAGTVIPSWYLGTILYKYRRWQVWIIFLSLNSANLVKTFRETQILCFRNTNLFYQSHQVSRFGVNLQNPLRADDITRNRRVLKSRADISGVVTLMYQLLY